MVNLVTAFRQLYIALLPVIRMFEGALAGATFIPDLQLPVHDQLLLFWLVLVASLIIGVIEVEIILRNEDKAAALARGNKYDSMDVTCTRF